MIENFHPDIIGIANPDTIFDGSFVRKVKEVFAEKPDYAVLTGFQLDIFGRSGGHPFWEDESSPGTILKVALYGASIRPLRILLEKFLPRQDYKSYVEGVRNSKYIPHQVWAVEGSVFFIRASDFESVGFFDDNIFLYYEENILAFKIDRQLHKKIGVINTITYVHAHKPYPEELTSDVIRRRMNVIKIAGVSSQYYFSHYVTGSKFLHVVHKILVKLGYIRLYFSYRAKMLVQKLRKKRAG